MKNSITLLIALLISIVSFSQEGFNYKAVIKDDFGNVIAGQDVTLRFTIFEFNNPYYQETHATTTDDNGIVILTISEGTHTNYGQFASIPWHYQNSDFFLNVEIDISGGTSFVDMGTTQFKAVPIAKYAERVNVGNMYIGVNNLHDGISDGYSIFLGHHAGTDDDASNNRNSSLGYYSLNKNTSGNQNVAIGSNSLQNNLTGSNNVAIGSYALENNIVGYSNVALGAFSGRNNTGNRNVFIGTSAGSISFPNESNRLYIDNTSTNSPLIYGEFDTDLLRINGTLDVTEEMDIGGPLTIQDTSNATSTWRLETRPNGSLSLYRNGSYRGFFSESTGNYSSISDRSTKKGITSLDNGTLNKLMQLNPVSYLMKDQTDTKRNLGLISQEVQEIFPSITTYVEESDLITLSYTELIPILIKALQEQQGIIEAQKAKDIVQDKSISEQSQTIKSLVARLDTIEAKSSN